MIAGGHGKIALRLGRMLAGRGDRAVGLIRDPEHAEDLRAAGMQPMLFDLEASGPVALSEHLDGTDAVVFAAGAGPGSGATRKDTVDRAGAALLADAAERARVRRYLLIGTMGVDVAPTWSPPPEADEVFAAYLRAKAASERDLRARSLDWTVLRPGRLIDEPGTGRVRLAPPPVPRGDVSRDDVATVLLALLDEPGTIGLTLELVRGDTPVADAVTACLPSI